MLLANNIAKEFKHGNVIIEALRKVNLSVFEGELVAIMGKSGSGKTTLLKIIGCLLTPTNGHILIDGKNIYQEPTKKRCILRRKYIGFVNQSFDLIPELSVYENIILPLLLDKKRIEADRINSLCEPLLIQDKMQRYPIELSGGEQQRVAIARALINSPKLLLLDEPTGNLDQQITNQVLDLICYINQKIKTTVLIVTHDVDVAKRADRCISISDGILC